MKKGNVLTLAVATCFVIVKVAVVSSLLLAACTTNPPSGAIYYVAQSGSDTNPGTEAQPWLTIQKAANTLMAGDSVLIKTGTYQERVVPANSGTEGDYITYADYPGNTVTIDGSGITLPPWGGLVDLTGRSYITVSGLRVINAGPDSNNTGILADGSSHIIIEKNFTSNTMSSGIGVWGSDNVIIDGNEVELACKDGIQEFISVGGTSNFEVKNNHVHNGTPEYVKEGICVKDGSNNGTVYGNHVHDVVRVGVYVDAWDKHTYNIDVFKNVIHDIADNNGISLASEMGGLLENIKIYNNVAYHNRYCGVSISTNGPGGAQGQHPMKNIRVVNNTFYNNGWTVWGGGINIENPYAEDVVVRNNICSQNLYFQLAVDAIVPLQNFTVDHNLIDGFRGTEGEIYGSDSVIGDPDFVNPVATNFRLQAASPAIDTGSSIEAPADDFDGNPRPHGSGFDIGAFEYVGTGNVESSKK